MGQNTLKAFILKAFSVSLFSFESRTGHQQKGTPYGVPFCYVLPSGEPDGFARAVENGDGRVFQQTERARSEDSKDQQFMRQWNAEIVEYERMKAYYAEQGQEPPYKSLGAFRSEVWKTTKSNRLQSAFFIPKTNFVCWHINDKKENKTVGDG